jgi:hypothetical protein
VSGGRRHLRRSGVASQEFQGFDGWNFDGISLGNLGKNHGRHGENMGKIWEKHWKNMGKSWENHWEIIGEWEINGKNNSHVHEKIIGKMNKKKGRSMEQRLENGEFNRSMDNGKLTTKND